MKDARPPLDRIPGAPVPAHLAPFVEVLGADAAVEFLLKFGGGVSYFSENPQARSALVEAIGAEKTRALARRLGAGSLRVPTGKKYIARYWRDRGLNITAIARKLHVTDSTVRNMLRRQDDRQLALFDLPPTSETKRLFLLARPWPRWRVGRRLASGRCHTGAVAWPSAPAPT